MCFNCIVLPLVLQRFPLVLHTPFEDVLCTYFICTRGQEARTTLAKGLGNRVFYGGKLK